MRSPFLKEPSSQARRFSLFAFVGCGTHLICLPIGLFLHGATLGPLVCGLCAAALLILSLIGKYTRWFQPCLYGMLGLMLLIEFPILYYLYGISCLSYLLLGIAAIAVFMRRPYRFGLLAGAIIFDTAVILISHYVSTVPGRLGEGETVNWVVCSFLAAACSLAALISLLTAQYEQQARQLSAMSHALKDAAITDPLTKVYNRRYLTGYLGGLMRQPGAEITVVLLDIDHFKAVNDQYGHVFGDATLAHFAAGCAHAMEGRGIVARYGGEEFMLVFRRASHRKIAAALTEIRDDLLHFSTLEKGVPFTFSGGVAMYTPGMRVTALYNAADEKLYRAKNSGRNKIIY